MLNGVDDAFNAASAAGPLVIISMAILVLAAVTGIGIWKLVPLLVRLADKIPLALEIMKAEVETSNKESAANASAIGGLAEAISQLVSTIHAVQEKHQGNQLQLSESQEKLSSHFGRSVDVLSNIYDRMGAQSTQMDLIIGTTSATKKTADDTHNSVTQIQSAINSGVDQLGKIVGLLNELKLHSEQQLKSTDLDRVALLIESTKAEMLQAVKGMYEPAKLTVPSSVTGYEVEVEKKEEVSSEQV
jgi:methyl-accepting chemotaxis protein